MNVIPHGHRVALHDLVRILARNARIDQGEQHLGGIDQAAREIEIGLHAGGIQDETVHDADEAGKHVVERHEAVRLGNTLGGAVRDVALMPQRDVIERDLGVGLHDAGEATDLLKRNGIALVRHSRAALLALAERLLHLEGVGLLEAADLGSDTVASRSGSGEHAGQVRMVIARDNLGGQRVVCQTEMLADILLDERVDGAVGANRSGDGSEGDVLAGVHQAVEVTLKLPGPAAELHTEGHGLGVDAVGTAHAQGVALLERAAAADLSELAHILDDDVGRLDELVAQGGVTQVGAGHTVVDPAAGLGLALRNLGVDVLAHVGEEGDDVMMGDRLDSVDLGPIEPGVFTNPGSILFGDAALAEFGLGLTGEHLNLLPNGVLVLEREDVGHLRTGVAIDHDEGSFHEKSPTPPRYRALMASMERVTGLEPANVSLGS